MARTGFQPLYTQVRNALVSRLTAGEWMPGAVLPGESMLAAEMQVSTGTMRKAVDSLVADGVLRRHQGKGTYVIEQTPEQENYHFFRLVDSDGAPVLPEAVSEKSTTAAVGVETALRLGISRDDTVVVIDRIRAIAGHPAILETIKVPSALMPGLERLAPLPNALYPHYQARHAITVISTQDWLSAAGADAAAAKALAVPLGTPLLLAERVAHDLTGRAVEWRRSRFLSNGPRYAVTLG